MLSGLCRFSQPQARLLIPLRYLQRPVMRSHTDLSGFLSPKTLDLSALYDGHRSFKSQLKPSLKTQLEQTQTLPSIVYAAGEFRPVERLVAQALVSWCRRGWSPDP